MSLSFAWGQDLRPLVSKLVTQLENPNIDHDVHRSCALNVNGINPFWNWSCAQSKNITQFMNQAGDRKKYERWNPELISQLQKLIKRRPSSLVYPSDESYALIVPGKAPHLVGSTDTLQSIASQEKTSINDLRKSNGRLLNIVEDIQHRPIRDTDPLSISPCLYKLSTTPIPNTQGLCQNTDSPSEIVVTAGIFIVTGPYPHYTPDDVPIVRDLVEKAYSPVSFQGKTVRFQFQFQEYPVDDRWVHADFNRLAWDHRMSTTAKSYIHELTIPSYPLVLRAGEQASATARGTAEGFAAIRYDEKFSSDVIAHELGHLFLTLFHTRTGEGSNDRNFFDHALGGYMSVPPGVGLTPDFIEKVLAGLPNCKEIIPK